MALFDAHTRTVTRQASKRGYGRRGGAKWPSSAEGVRARGAAREGHGWMAVCAGDVTQAKMSVCSKYR